MFLTLQEIFDKVVTHLLGQNKQAKNYNALYGTENCAYRGDNGTKCAVGCLIPDERYTASLEGKNAYYVINDTDALEGIVDPSDARAADLLRNLQRVHDAAEPKYWKERLKAVGTIYGVFNQSIY